MNEKNMKSMKARKEYVKQESENSIKKALIKENIRWKKKFK